MEELEFEFSLEPESDEVDGSLESGDERVLKVRLDKWLWAARFFKTRALARAAVENGKVFYNGQRSKPSREIEVEAILQIRHGRFEKTVIVKGLSTRRRSTEEALQLFEETEESRLARETAAQYSQPFERQPRYYDRQPRYYNQQPYPYEQQPNRYYEQSPHPYEQRPRQYHQQSQPYEQQPQERRTVRFLRRSFVRGNEQPRQPAQQSPYHPQYSHSQQHEEYET